MNYPEKIQLVLTYQHDLEDEEIFTEKVDAIKAGDYFKIVHVQHLPQTSLTVIL